MYLSELLEIAEDLRNQYGEDYDPEIEVHFQPNYPLKGTLENVRELDGKLAFAAGDGYNYGSKEAWEQSY
ncbi:hypothetical protein J6O86_02965 [bacterium]|nr:hypothetical protein [bacterium]